MDGIRPVDSSDVLKKPTSTEEDIYEPTQGTSSMHMRMQEGDEAGNGEGPSTRGRKKRRFWQSSQENYSHSHYKVYKRRWFGLAQLVLLNVVVSWDVSTSLYDLYAL